MKGIIFTFSSPLDIAPDSPRAVPALLHVLPRGRLLLRHAHLPGGGGTLTPPLVLARGVAPGHGLTLLRDEHSGVEADGCAGMVPASFCDGLFTYKALYKKSKTHQQSFFSPQPLLSEQQQLWFKDEC